jgi:hypothetical protein
LPTHTTQALQTPSELTVALSPDETRLAWLGLVDFEGDWAVLEAATAIVVDGATKAALIREHLRPIAERLPSLLTGEVDSVQMWTARHWFDTQACQPRTP